MLTTMINIGIIAIALLHLWFFILETFLWQKPLGQKIFKIEPDFAKRSALLAANQGVYNALLSAGLCWSLINNNQIEALHLKIFFLTCVIVAGSYEAMTVSRRIFYIQALPAIITLVLIIFLILTTSS